MNTRKQNIIDHLEQKGELGSTGLELLRHGGGIDYRKYISDLRKSGYNITDSWEGSGRYHYKRYYLVGETITRTL